MDYIVFNQESTTFNILAECFRSNLKHLIQCSLSANLQFLKRKTVCVHNFTKIVEIDLAIYYSLLVRFFTFIVDMGQVKQLWIDLEFKHEFTFLVHQFLFKLLLFRIPELLRAHHEPMRVPS